MTIFGPASAVGTVPDPCLQPTQRGLGGSRVVLSGEVLGDRGNAVVDLPHLFRVVAVHCSAQASDGPAGPRGLAAGAVGYLARHG